MDAQNALPPLALRSFRSKNTRRHEEQRGQRVQSVHTEQPKGWGGEYGGGLVGHWQIVKWDETNRASAGEYLAGTQTTRSARRFLLAGVSTDCWSPDEAGGKRL